MEIRTIGIDDENLHFYEEDAMAELGYLLVEMFVGWDLIDKLDETEPDRPTYAHNMECTSYLSWQKAVVKGTVYDDMIIVYDGRGNWYV